MAPTTPKVYKQKYVKEWELSPTFKGWLKPFTGDNTRAYCAFCKTDMKAHKRSLKEHAQSNKHIRSVKNDRDIKQSAKINPNFAVPLIDDKRKIVELKIAAFIAEHCSIKTVDHLGEVGSSLDEESKTLSKIKIHRTKCTDLIVNVLAPCLFEELIEDVGDSHYSLILDEITAIDTKKGLGFMIRYFSKKLRRVNTTFYQLVEIESGTAEDLTNCIKNQIEKDGLKVDHLIGIGIDGASAMNGPHNSVSSKLKKINKHLVSVLCLCHSVHNSAEKACDTLPRHLDTLVKKSHSWFSKSTKRNVNYIMLFKTMEDDSNPKKIPKKSGTRWLARLDAIEVILDHWEALKLHLNLSMSAEKGDKGYKSQELFNMYNDSTNRLYLIFLKHALKNVVTVNKVFQFESAEPFKLLQDLKNLLYETLNSIVVPSHLERAVSSKEELQTFDFKKYVMSANCINFGYAFNAESGNHPPEILAGIKERCRGFLIKLCEELQTRTPKNIEVLQKLSLLSPEIASRQYKASIVDLAEEFKDICGDVDATCSEYDLLHRLEINAKTSDEYWTKVSEATNAAGEQRFKHISNLAMSLFSLPFSNASVERAFSIFNIIKNKLRNKISFETANAILRVRYSLSDGCTKFQCTPKMLKKFNSENVYKADFDVEDFNSFQDVNI